MDSLPGRIMPRRRRHVSGSTLEGKWDLDSEFDSELLKTAIARCDPVERARHVRSRTAARGRFERLLRANVAQRSPALKLSNVALLEDSEDYFRLSSLQVTWQKGGKADVTN